MSSETIESNFDASLGKAVDCVLKTYDPKGTGVLQIEDIRRLLSDGYQRLHTKRTATEDDVNRFFEAVDKNKNGKITRAELIDALKHIAESP